MSESSSSAGSPNSQRASAPGGDKSPQSGGEFSPPASPLIDSPPLSPEQDREGYEVAVVHELVKLHGVQDSLLQCVNANATAANALDMVLAGYIRSLELNYPIYLASHRTKPATLFQPVKDVLFACVHALPSLSCTHPDSVRCESDAANAALVENCNRARRFLVLEACNQAVRRACQKVTKARLAEARQAAVVARANQELAEAQQAERLKKASADSDQVASNWNQQPHDDGHQLLSSLPAQEQDNQEQGGNAAEGEAGGDIPAGNGEEVDEESEDEEVADSAPVARRPAKRKRKRAQKKKTSNTNTRPYKRRQSPLSLADSQAEQSSKRAASSASRKAQLAADAAFENDNQSVAAHYRGVVSVDVQIGLAIIDNVLGADGYDSLADLITAFPKEHRYITDVIAFTSRALMVGPADQRATGHLSVLRFVRTFVARVLLGSATARNSGLAEYGFDLHIHQAGVLRGEYSTLITRSAQDRVQFGYFLQDSHRKYAVVFDFENGTGFKVVAVEDIDQAERVTVYDGNVVDLGPTRMNSDDSSAAGKLYALNRMMGNFSHVQSFLHVTKQVKARLGSAGFGLDGKFITPFDDVGAGSFCNSSESKLDANLVQEVVYAGHEHVALCFKATRKINKGEELLYFYSNHLTHNPAPLISFFPLSRLSSSSSSCSSSSSSSSSSWRSDVMDKGQEEELERKINTFDIHARQAHSDRVHS